MSRLLMSVRTLLLWGVLSLLTLARGQIGEPTMAAAKSPAAEGALSNRVFEIRTYTTSQPMDVFLGFFRKNTVPLFKKHGFEPVAYWRPQDAPRSQNTFVYVLAFPDRETAERLWNAFLTDPDWVTARTDFRAKNGPVTDKIEPVFVSPTEFSPLK